MNDLVTAGLIGLAVFAAAMAVQWLVKRRGGQLLGLESGRGLTTFAVAIGVLAGLGWWLVDSNPSTTDTLVVSLIRSIPSLLLAGLILILAVILGRALGTLTSRALRSWSAVLASRIGRMVRIATIAIGVIVALEEIGVSTELIIIVIAAVVSAVALATALAVGLGSVPLAKNVAAGRHVLNRFEVGQHLSSAGFAGEVVEIGLSSVSLSTPTGMLEVPHLLLLEQAVEVSTSASPD